MVAGFQGSLGQGHSHAVGGGGGGRGGRGGWRAAAAQGVLVVVVVVVTTTTTTSSSSSSSNHSRVVVAVWELGNLLAEGGDQLDLRGLVIPDEVTTIL
eukprot:scaffold29786_cov65-Phaeocystis_antarctica.AAC.2